MTVSTIALDRWPMAALLIDADFAILAANQGFCALIARDWADLRARSYGEITHADDLAAELRGWRQLAAGAGEIAVDKRFLRGDGRAVAVTIHAAALAGGSGSDGVLISVHPRPVRAATATATPAGSAVDESDLRRDLGHVCALASHDLRQQARMATSFLGVLAAHHAGVLDERGRRFLDQAAQHAGRLGDMVEAVADWLRLRLASEPLRECASDEALAAALDACATDIADSAALITRDPLPRVHADPAQLAQLFGMLIGNALVHRGARPPRIHIGCRQDARMWEFAVGDDGPGIPDQWRERVLRPFVTVPAAVPTTRLGLGLARCRAIVERHQGRLWIEAGDPVGTMVRFTLPVSPTG